MLISVRKKSAEGVNYNKDELTFHFLLLWWPLVLCVEWSSVRGQPALWFSLVHHTHILTVGLNEERLSI